MLLWQGNGLTGAAIDAERLPGSGGAHLRQPIPEGGPKSAVVLGRPLLEDAPRPLTGEVAAASEQQQRQSSAKRKKRNREVTGAARAGGAVSSFPEPWVHFDHAILNLPASSFQFIGGCPFFFPFVAPLRRACF